MPIKSMAQQRAMYAAAAGRGKIGIPQETAREYIKATSKSAYADLPERAKRRMALKRKAK
jgi:hypothetical protein